MTQDLAPEIVIVGGVYRERCLRPSWTEIFGSGGRAASAIAAAGAKVQLFTYVDQAASEVLAARGALEGFQVVPTFIEPGLGFGYDHGLAAPQIDGLPPVSHSPFQISAHRVLRFGMLEGDAIVRAEQAVYDPQNAVHPVHFDANGSTAKRLAIVLNHHEASLLAGQIASKVEDLARTIQRMATAEVVVIKHGPRGAFVLDGQTTDHVPAFQSKNVWKIGSGDTFAANFAHAWMALGLSASDSAERASKATAFYCETQGFADSAALAQFGARAITPSKRFLEGYLPKVYLAGPFFSLAQVWLVEQAREDLAAAGVEVFSPYHDVGHGSAEDVVPKDIDGLEQADPCTCTCRRLGFRHRFRDRYARALGKPVIIYCERELPDNLKMMRGTDCLVEHDYVTAIYRTVWCLLFVKRALLLSGGWIRSRSRTGFALKLLSPSTTASFPLQRRSLQRRRSAGHSGLNITLSLSIAASWAPVIWRVVLRIRSLQRRNGGHTETNYLSRLPL